VFVDRGKQLLEGAAAVQYYRQAEIDREGKLDFKDGKLFSETAFLDLCIQTDLTDGDGLVLSNLLGQAVGETSQRPPGGYFVSDPGVQTESGEHGGPGGEGRHFRPGSFVVCRYDHLRHSLDRSTRQHPFRILGQRRHIQMAVSVDELQSYLQIPDKLRASVSISGFFPLVDREATWIPFFDL